MASVPKSWDKNQIAELQRNLNIVLGTNLVDDGIFGNASVTALKQLQKQAGLVDDGLWGNNTKNALEAALKDKASSGQAVPSANPKKITSEEIVQVAKSISVEPEALNAVMMVEAKKSGFLASGKPVILFERHWFYKFLKKKLSSFDLANVMAQNSDICNASPGGYQGMEAEWKRMDRAVAIEKESAYLSASWGLGQVMGFNHEPAGFADVFSFVQAMQESEAKQLQAMANFIKANPSMHRALINKDWAAFAKAYNGPAYRNNLYDEKLASAYKSLKK